VTVVRQNNGPILGVGEFTVLSMTCSVYSTVHDMLIVSAWPHLWTQSKVCWIRSKFQTLFCS